MRHTLPIAFLLLTACPSGVTVPVEGEDMAELDQGEDVTEEMGSRDEQCPEGPDWRECDDGDPRTDRDRCREEGCVGNPCRCDEVSLCCDGCGIRGETLACMKDGISGLCSGGTCATGL